VFRCTVGSVAVYLSLDFRDDFVEVFVFVLEERSCLLSLVRGICVIMMIVMMRLSVRRWVERARRSLRSSTHKFSKTSAPSPWRHASLNRSSITLSVECKTVRYL